MIHEQQLIDELTDEEFNKIINDPKFVSFGSGNTKRINKILKKKYVNCLATSVGLVDFRILNKNTSLTKLKFFSNIITTNNLKKIIKNNNITTLQFGSIEMINCEYNLLRSMKSLTSLDVSMFTLTDTDACILSTLPIHYLSVDVNVVNPNMFNILFKSIHITHMSISNTCIIHEFSKRAVEKLSSMYFIYEHSY
jgi:hypothetical protein